MASDPPPRDAFHELHPSSLLFGIGRHAKALLLPAAVLLVLSFFSQGGGRWEYWLAILFVPSALYETYLYLTVRYHVSDDELVVKRGLIFRRERHIPLSRIQNIDITQNPLHRWLKVAEARVETAGGGSGAESEAVFKVLSLDAIDRLRNSVFAGRETGAAPAAVGVWASADASAEPGDALLRIPATELVKLGMISNRGMTLIAVVLGLAWEFGLHKRAGAGWTSFQQHASGWNWMTSLLVLAGVMIVGFLLLRVLSVAWIVLYFHGYELRRVGDDLRMRCGLITRVTATIPKRRIQLVSVQQTLLQRWLGRASIRVETAGSTGGIEGTGERGTLSRRWFVPTVDVREVPRLLAELRPGLDADFAEAAWTPPAPGARGRMMRLSFLIALAITAIATLVFRPWGALAGLVLIPWGLWHAHVEWRFMGYARSASGLLFRSGAWTRRTSATFYDKMQVVSKNESPFDRRFGMASLAIDTAGAGPAEHKVRVPYLPRQTVVELTASLLEAAGRTRFRW